MKLIEIGIKNFRSLINTNKVPISQVTVIVGKNNQGKSNFIKAIDITFQSIAQFSVSRIYRMRRSSIYDYNRDFPLFEKNNSRKTEISMKLSISIEESNKLYEILI